MSELSTPLCLLDLLRAHCSLPLHWPQSPEEAPWHEDEEGSGDRGGVVWASDAESDGESTQRCLRALGPPKSAFWRARIVAESGRSWDKFYLAHGEGFFLQRSYLERDFPSLRGARHAPLRLLEFGCGTGASLLPLLAALPHLRATGFDLSPHAISLARAHPVALGVGAGRCLFFVGDATDPDCSVAQQVARAARSSGGSGGGAFDAVLLLFCLSAIAPELHAAVLQRAAECLRPGGLLLLRDYGAGDEAQTRFGRGAKLDERGSVMVRRDGTLAAFLDLEELRRHAAAAGLEETAPVCHQSTTGGSHYLRRRYTNRGTAATLRRCFVHATFRLPPMPGSA